MLRRTSGEEIAVESVSEPTLRQPETRTEPAATAILDVRTIPLETLAQDAGARCMVDEILARMDTPTRVSVAMFNSAILSTASCHAGHDLAVCAQGSQPL